MIQLTGLPPTPNFIMFTRAELLMVADSSNSTTNQADHVTMYADNSLARSANLPTGLYILPSVISSEQSYLSIYWTDFRNLFTKWKIFA